MTITVSPKLSIIFACIIPVLGGLITLAILKVFPVYRKAFKRYDTFNASIQENVKGMRVVKSYVREDHEREKFRKESGALRKIFTKADSIIMLSSPLMQTAMFTAMLLLSVLGSLIIIKTFGGYNGVTPQWGELSTGQLSSLLTYSMQILSSLMMFAMVITMIAMSAESGRRIVEVLNEKSTITSRENAVKEVNDGEIIFDNVYFRYAADA